MGVNRSYGFVRRVQHEGCFFLLLFGGTLGDSEAGFSLPLKAPARTKWALYLSLVPSCSPGCFFSIPNVHLSSARFVLRAILQVGRRHAWSSSPTQQMSRYGSLSGFAGP